MLVGPININNFIKEATFNPIEETNRFLLEMENEFCSLDEANNPLKSKMSKLKDFISKQKEFSSKLVKKQIAELSKNAKCADNLVSTSSPYIYLYRKSKYFEYPMVRYNICGNDYLLNDIIIQLKEGLISLFKAFKINFTKKELEDSKVIKKKVEKYISELDDEVRYVRGALLCMKKISVNEDIDKYIDKAFFINGSKEPVTTLIDKTELHACLDRLKHSYSTQKDILKAKEEYIKKDYDLTMEFIEDCGFILINCVDANLEDDEKLDIYLDNDCLSEYASLSIKYVKLIYNDYLRILSKRLSYLNDSFKQDEAIVRKVINVCKK